MAEWAMPGRTRRPGRPGRRSARSITEVAMTGRTGERCPRSGIWQGDDRCRERIALSHNEIFPPCHDDGNAVTWTLVQPT
jgi:hypothetical protein